MRWLRRGGRVGGRRLRLERRTGRTSSCNGEDDKPTQRRAASAAVTPHLASLPQSTWKVGWGHSRLVRCLVLAVLLARTQRGFVHLLIDWRLAPFPLICGLPAWPDHCPGPLTLEPESRARSCQSKTLTQGAKNVRCEVCHDKSIEQKIGQLYRRNNERPLSYPHRDIKHSDSEGRGTRETPRASCDAMLPQRPCAASLLHTQWQALLGVA